ncbi:MAG: ATP-binding protein [Gammaproteobacteria bacterium]|nr:ATP-binding protein [Gammaproteobacteria bacterium]
MKRGNRAVLLAGSALFVLLLISLLLMNQATQNSERFSRMYSGLLLVNAFGLAALLALIGLNIRHLIRQVVKKAPGSLLTARMVTFIAVLVLVPVFIVYAFSLDFLRRGIDSWFDVRIEHALEDSLELSRSALNIRMRELLQESNALAEQLSALPDAALPPELDDLQKRSGARELTLLTRQGAIISSSSDDVTELVPSRPEEATWLQLQQGNSYISLDPVREGIFIRAIVNVPPGMLENEPRVLQALFPISEQMSELANSVQTALGQYKRLSYLRSQLKLSFIMILTLVLLFSVFGGVWGAFIASRKLVAPIRHLARGTQEVAAGKYDTQLPVSGKDELGSLVVSFNEMTREVARAQEEAEAQNAYLQAVLGRISSGVLVLDESGRLRTFNAGAEQVLGIPLARESIGRTLAELCRKHEQLIALVAMIDKRLGCTGEWREQVIYFGRMRRSILNCSGASFPSPHGGGASHVIVLDDVTRLVQSQRDAAWTEVAKRLAHEIKNPLTPIQLSAERLQSKYGNSARQPSPETLKRLTNTIIQQVKTMQGMVDAFASYARPPKLCRTALDFNQLLLESLDLYRNVDAAAKIDADIAALPPLYADADKLRQVLNNLLSNALEADKGGQPMRLSIVTRAIREGENHCIELQLKDTGRGFEKALLDRSFEPYVTTKTGGTGLGLAIVKKIVEDHGGIVWIYNNEPPPGACVVLRLPLGYPDQAGEAGGALHPDYEKAAV